MTHTQKMGVYDAHAAVLLLLVQQRTRGRFELLIALQALMYACCMDTIH